MLKGLSLLFLASWLVHSADHIRRGTDTTPDGVLWGGTVAAVLAAIALTLVFTDHPTAPAVVTVVFASLAVGVSATHLLPDWGPLSEPLLIDSVTDGWAAAAAIGEILAAAVLAVAGWRVLRANHYRFGAP